MRLAIALFVGLLALHGFAAEPSPPAKQRKLDTVMMTAADDGADSVVHTFGPGGEAQCRTKAIAICGSCSIQCPIGKAAFCVVGTSSEFPSPTCPRPPSCTCK